LSVETDKCSRAIDVAARRLWPQRADGLQAVDAQGPLARSTTSTHQLLHPVRS
jgi:hypothetical protein